jgi:hypothetical protein
MPVITAWIEAPLSHVRYCAVVIQVSSKLSPTVATVEDPNKLKEKYTFIEPNMHSNI